MGRVILGLSIIALSIPAAAHAQGSPSFTEMDVGFSGLGGSEVNWGDYDNDGDLDLAIEGLETGTRFTRLYRNDGGTFVHETGAGLFPYNEGPIIFGDYDQDGDLDLAFGGWSGSGTGSRIYRNEGSGSFVWLNEGLRGMKGADGAWGDYDNDGDLDLVLVGESYDPPQGDYSQIYRNDGNNQFNLAVSLTGLYLGEVSLGDYDQDGDLDIALTGRTVGARIYRNDGGTFTDIGAVLPALVNGSISWGDLDGDGDLDFALSGDDGGGNILLRLYRNNTGTFVDIVAGLPGVHTGELEWADYDNDGDCDLLATGRDAAGTPVSIVYRNNGSGVFSDAGLGLTGLWNQSSAAWGDYDGDGDLDLALTGQDAAGTDMIKIYRNDSSTPNTSPSVPGGLSAIVNGNEVIFWWTASTDTETPAAALSYNLRVGTTAGGEDVMAAMANLSTGFRRLPARGNAQSNLAWAVKSLPPGDYYYSVQAIDSGFAPSGWSTEQTVTVSALVRVTALSPAPGSTLTGPPSAITVTLDAAVDPGTLNSTSVRLVRAGVDGTLGTADDVPVIPNSITAPGNQILMDLAGLNLPNDQYRLTVRGNEPAFPNAVNWWKLDEGNGPIAADSVGSDTGTLGTGGISPTWTAGRLGPGLTFAGLNDRVFLGVTDLPAPWTAAMWVNRSDSASSDARLMDSSSYSLRLEQFNGTSNMGVTAYGSTDALFAFVAPVGQWVHVTFVGESDGTSLYVNGAFSQKIGTVISCPRNTLGSGGFNSMAGVLDDVRLFDRKLNPTEIVAISGLGGVVRNTPGNPLDGEYSGTFPSGDGGSGGDFMADFTLAVPAPTVTAMTPAPGVVLSTAPAAISITTTGPLDPASVSASTISVVRAGPDGNLGTGDDVTVTPTSVQLTSGTVIDLTFLGGLPDDLYRVTLSGTAASLPTALNHWTFEEGVGVTAGDAAGGNPGTLGGAGGTTPLWAVGRVGNALIYNGGKDRVNTAAGDVTVPWTVTLWVRRSDAPSVDARLMDSISFPNGTSLRLEQFSGTNEVGISQYGVADYTLGYTAPVGMWTHLTFQGTGAGVSLYANGQLVGSIGTSLGLSRYNLGSHGDNSIIGSLDDVRVYGVALTEPEIALVAALDGAIRNTGYLRLDGEFSGGFPSGDGTQGGDFVATFTVSAGSPPSPVITGIRVGGCGLGGVELLLLLLVFGIRRAAQGWR